MHRVPARRVVAAASLCALACTMTACSPGAARPAAESTAAMPDANAPSASATPATSTPTAAGTGTSAQLPADSAGWRPLFDGHSLAGWRGYKEQGPPATGWADSGGVVVKHEPQADIISDAQYGDFELQWEWKLSPAGNAGVFYRATEEYEKVYWSGIEYQLLDDARHPDGRSRLTSAGAAYAVYPSAAGAVKPAEQWNASRIVARGAHVEHWLNGRKVVDYELWSPDWEARVAKAKFKDWPNYGRAKSGHIAIQGDHTGTLMIRNMRIRTLP